VYKINVNRLTKGADEVSDEGSEKLMENFDKAWRMRFRGKIKS